MWRSKPKQPVAATATVVVVDESPQRLAPGVSAGAGLVIGATMVVLAATGLLERIAKPVPKMVVRGIQVGLGLSLAMLALKEYAGADGWPDRTQLWIALLVAAAVVGLPYGYLVGLIAGTILAWARDRGRGKNRLGPDARPLRLGPTTTWLAGATQTFPVFDPASGTIVETQETLLHSPTGRPAGPSATTLF